MNTLDCGLSIKLNSSGFYRSADLNPNSNLILFDLPSGQEHILTIRIKNETDSNEEGFAQVFVFNATSEKVNVLFDKNVFDRKVNNLMKRYFA